jgi:DnaJ-class molecular chaperone
MTLKQRETCRRCRGCGQIANSDDGEPWTFWAELPAPSNLAVQLGIVRPIPCPDCKGTGQRP